MRDPEMDIYEIFEAQRAGVFAPRREAGKPIGRRVLVEMDAEPERTHELMLGLFHELEIGGVVDDSCHVGFGELDTALFSVFRWHGIKLQHRHDLCEGERGTEERPGRIREIMPGSGSIPWCREPFGLH